MEEPGVNAIVELSPNEFFVTQWMPFGIPENGIFLISNNVGDAARICKHIASSNFSKKFRSDWVSLLPL